MAQSASAQTHGAERGLSRLEGFSDAVFAIALTLLIVANKAPGSPAGPNDYSDLVRAMAEQWREHLALVLCYVVIGAYWLQHHYTGRIYAKSDHWFSAINLLFLLAIVVVPYPIRVWCFHLGAPFESDASMTLVVGLALTACAWMAKWFYARPGRRVMDDRLAPAFVRQMTRRYAIGVGIQIAAVPLALVAPRPAVGLARFGRQTDSASWKNAPLFPRLLFSLLFCLLSAATFIYCGPSTRRSRSRFLTVASCGIAKNCGCGAARGKVAG